ncbi:probable phospholipid hydroperoxide glutathione peroxidase [Solanum verrucosum]|nr:probable phospholipid hydroperoxide glutathione peroxidase [Solanum verrucosum]
MENRHGLKSWHWGQNHEIEAEKGRIRRLANFPIFDKVEVNDDSHDNLYRFMRTSRNIPKIEEEFEKFLIDGNGIPIKHFIRYDGETLEPQPVRPGEYPGESFTSKDTNPIKAEIDKFHWETESQ